jgi:hypothetical protein
MSASTPSTPRRATATPATPQSRQRVSSNMSTCSSASKSTSANKKNNKNRPLGQLAQNTLTAHAAALRAYTDFCKTTEGNFSTIEEIPFEHCMEEKWWRNFAQYLVNRDMSRKSILQYLSGVKEYYKKVNPASFKSLFDEATYTKLRADVEKATFQDEAPEELLTLSFGREEMKEFMSTLIKENRADRMDQAAVCLTSFMASGRSNELVTLNWHNLGWNNDFQTTVCTWKQAKVYSFKNMSFHCDFSTPELDWHFIMGSYILLGAGKAVLFISITFKSLFYIISFIYLSQDASQ